MKITGRHLTVDMYGCDFDALNDLEFIKEIMVAAIREANLTLLDFSSYEFEPYGVTALALLAESHMSIHTYPDLGYAAIDIFTCSSQSHPNKAIAVFKARLKPEKIKTTHVRRGDFGAIKDMKPKTKLSLAPLRRIRNTGARVIRLLKRSDKS